MPHALLTPTISPTDTWIKLPSVQWYRLSSWNDPCITVSANNGGSLSCGGTRSRCAGRQQRVTRTSLPTSGAGLWSRGNCGGHLHTKVTLLSVLSWLFVPCVAFPGPGNKLNLAPTAFWGVQALDTAIQSSGSSFRSSCMQFLLICTANYFASADMTSLLWSCSSHYITKTDIIHHHSYLLST